MPSDPSIVNRSPAQGAVAVSAKDPVLFGLRDADTRVTLGSIFAAMVHSKTSYAPDASNLIPKAVSGLPATFSMFNDAFGATDPSYTGDEGESADESAVDGVYSIERAHDYDDPAIPDGQKGFLYLYEEVPVSKPIAVEATLTPTVTTTGTVYSYCDFADWTGMLLGLIHWQRNSGIFLFFRDDGAGTKYITIAGPAENDVGHRTAVTTDYVLDWSADNWTYRILWDDTAFHRKVVVLALSSDGATEHLLADIAVEDIPTFRGSFSLGGKSATSSVAMLIVGNDGGVAGDRLDITDLKLFAFGRDMLVGGRAFFGSTVGIASNSMALLTGSTTGWAAEGTGGTVSVEDSIAITRASEDADTYVLSRAEPGLERQEWVLVVNCSVDNSSHLGGYTTGIGVDVDDGTSTFTVRFLDDFDETLEMGTLIDTASSQLLEGYTTFTADWPNDEIQMVLVGSAAKNIFKVFYNDDETPSIEATYTSVSASSSAGVRLGFCSSEGVFTGTLTVSSAWLFPTVQSYEGTLLTAPEDQGWTVVTAGGTVNDTTTDVLTLGMNEQDAYYIAYYTSEGYAEETGATLFLKAQVTGWTDDEGAASPIGPIGPIGAILLPDDDTEAIQIYLYYSSSGETFVCLPHSEDDFDGIAKQTLAGRAQSALIDLSVAHVYILEICPCSHIRLYLDYSTTPSIEVQWKDRSSITMNLPTNLPDSVVGVPVVGAFGSLNESYGVAVRVPFARVAVGTGYDLSAALTLSDDELTDHVFGSTASLYIDFSDEDP